MKTDYRCPTVVRHLPDPLQPSEPTPPPLCGWLDPTTSRPNDVTTIRGRPSRPHFTSLISPKPFTHLTHLFTSVAPMTGAVPPSFRSFPLIFHLLHSSFTPRRSAHSGSQRAFSTFSASLSGRELSLIQASSKTHALSVATGYTPVGSPFYVWCATSGATTATPGFIPQQTTCGWHRGAAP